VASFQTTTSSLRGMQLAWRSWFDLPCSSLYVNVMSTPSQQFEFALYADDTAIIATSRKPAPLFSYLESYLSDLQLWLSEGRIAINISKVTATKFARAGRRFKQPRQVTLFGEPIQSVDTTRYLGGGARKRLNWSPHIEQARKKPPGRIGLRLPS
jgi:hypothetical protein